MSILNLDFEEKNLPVFKVTALGLSGVGKTIFMSAMYIKLNGNDFGVRIFADHNTDYEMRENMIKIWRNEGFPPGNEGKIVNYKFELLFKDKPKAIIDWVDYKGGNLMKESDEDENVADIIKRIEESHCVVWMVDLTEFEGRNLKSTMTRELAGTLRIQNYTLNALKNSKNLRSVIFVRTKSDTVRDEHGEVDYKKACEEFLDHIGNLEKFDGINYTALVPVSSLGRIDNEDKVLGDDPHNVEWVLILALAFMLEKDLEQIDNKAKEAEEKIREVTINKAFKFVRALANQTGKTQKEIEASSQFSDITREMLAIQETFKDLIENVPNDEIKIFKAGD